MRQEAVFFRFQMDLTTLITKKNQYASRQVGGEYVIVPVRDNVAQMNTLVTLNEVGSFIWDRLVDGASTECLTTAIVAEFDVPPETAQQDLMTFLTSLTTTLKS